MPCADSSTICARRQVTTDPLERRTILRSRHATTDGLAEDADPSAVALGVPDSLAAAPFQDR
jgi:hypothetical protein